MKNTILLFILLCGSTIKGQTLYDSTPTDTIHLKSQTVELEIYKPLSNVIPPTPHSQMFEKYINHPTVESNGLPNINIPLYVITVDDIKIPITLSYYAGGVKYKQYDGDIGAGWSINAGGYRIIRSIYGQPDETEFYDEKVYMDLAGVVKDAYTATLEPNMNREFPYSFHTMLQEKK